MLIVIEPVISSFGSTLNGRSILICKDVEDVSKRVQTKTGLFLRCDERFKTSEEVVEFVDKNIHNAKRLFK